MAEKMTETEALQQSVYKIAELEMRLLAHQQFIRTLMTTLRAADPKVPAVITQHIEGLASLPGAPSSDDNSWKAFLDEANRLISKSDDGRPVFTVIDGGKGT